MLLKLIMLFPIFFIPSLAGCSMFDDVFEKNYSLSSVASFPDDVNELKKYGFFVKDV